MPSSVRISAGLGGSIGETNMRTLTAVIIVLGSAVSASNGFAQDEVLLNEWAELPPQAFGESVRIELCEGGLVKGEIDSLVQTDGVAFQVGAKQIYSSSISAVRLDEYKSNTGRTIGIPAGVAGGFLLGVLVYESDEIVPLTEIIASLAGAVGGGVLGWYFGREADRESTVFRKAEYCL
jgi:hypothetical protein